MSDLDVLWRWVDHIYIRRCCCCCPLSEHRIASCPSEVGITKCPLSRLANVDGPHEAKMTLSSLKNSPSAYSHPCMSPCRRMCSLATFEGKEVEF
jgi:hypothetical protein